MKNIVFRVICSTCCIHALTPAYAEEVESNYPCMTDQQLMIKHVSYLGNPNTIIKQLGKPLSTKRTLYHSGGNSGSYFLKHLVYEGLVIEHRDQPLKRDQPWNKIERFTLTGSAYAFGQHEIYIGQSKASLMGLFHVNSEADIMDLAEAELSYAGKSPVISSKSKKTWSLASCTLNPEATYIEFYFDRQDRLSKVKVYLDDSSI